MCVYENEGLKIKSREGADGEWIIVSSYLW